MASEVTMMTLIMAVVDQKVILNCRTDGTDDFTIWFTVAGYFEYADT